MLTLSRKPNLFSKLFHLTNPSFPCIINMLGDFKMDINLKKLEFDKIINILLEYCKK